MDYVNQLAYEKACDIFNERTNRFLGSGWSSCILLDTAGAPDTYVTFKLTFFDRKNVRVYKMNHTDLIDVLTRVYISNSVTIFNEFINSIWMNLFENVIKHIEETNTLPHYADDGSVTLYS